VNRRWSVLEIVVGVQVLVLVFLFGFFIWRQTVPGLIWFLRTGNTQMRIHAAQELGKKGAAARDAIPDLVNAMGDPDQSLQIVAGEAVARVGGLPALSDAVLHNPSPDARRRAIEHLRNIQPTSDPGVFAEVERLYLAGMGDPSPLVRRFSADYIGQLGPRARDVAQAPLADLMDNDPDRDVRVAALNGSCGIQSLDNVVHARFSPDRQIRQSSIYCLPKFGFEGVSTLVQDLQDGDVGIASTAANALAGMGAQAKDAEPALEQALSRPEPAVRTSAILALGAIGPENADAIERITNDPDPYTRAIAKNEFNRLRVMPPR
jgi:HEAT repeat protein